MRWSVTNRGERMYTEQKWKWHEPKRNGGSNVMEEGDYIWRQVSFIYHLLEMFGMPIAIQEMARVVQKIIEFQHNVYFERWTIQLLAFLINLEAKQLLSDNIFNKHWTVKWRLWPAIITAIITSKKHTNLAYYDSHVDVIIVWFDCIPPP